MQQNSFSCADAVNFYLANIQKNKHLNAFVEVYQAEALQRAALLDNKRKTDEPLKKLHGVVIAIKDVICFENHTVTAASKILQGFSVPLYCYRFAVFNR